MIKSGGQWNQKTSFSFFLFFLIQYISTLLCVCAICIHCISFRAAQHGCSPELIPSVALLESLLVSRDGCYLLLAFLAPFTCTRQIEPLMQRARVKRACNIYLWRFATRRLPVLSRRSPSTSHHFSYLRSCKQFFYVTRTRKRFLRRRMRLRDECDFRWIDRQISKVAYKESSCLIHEDSIVYIAASLYPAVTVFNRYICASRMYTRSTAYS